MQHSPARHAAPPLLEGQGDAQREVDPGGRIDDPLEGRHIDARRVDGKGRAVAGMGDRTAIAQPVAVKDQRSAGGPVLYRRGIGGQQGDRLAPCSRIPSGNGKVQHRVLLSAGVGDRRLTPRLSGGHGAHLDGGRVSVLTGRASGTCGASRTCGAGWAGRGDDKRKVAINPQTMGNYKKIKSITLRMEPSGTTWAAFLRGQAGKEEIY